MPVMDPALEILAPAGSRQQLEAAVSAGADAVYLGLKGFNARQGARNFSNQELPAVAAYCHTRGVRVYVTLNTLVMDEELPLVEEAITAAAEAGVDALIVQDLGVASLAKRLYSELPVHASTQMAIHNTWGVALLERMGFDRVVLARELSMDEIRQIAEATALPLEVFVHGAHCTSVSGNCYLSSMIGGRSGNRGLCAQPCRLDFRLNDRPYALSLKDLSVLGSLEQLAEAGVTSFKIEGRLKRPEYVAAAVAGSRESLAGGTADTDQLRALFSRSGFTDGYLMGRRTLEMFGHRTMEDVQASAEALETLSEVTPENVPSIGVDMKLRIADGEPASLTLSDGRHTVTVTGVVPQQAIEKELTRELTERSFRKTGGTPFALRQLEAQIESGLTLSVGDLNALRRKGLELLSECRNPAPVYERSSEGPISLAPYQPPDQAELRLRFERFDQIFEEAYAYRLILPLGQILEHPDLLQDEESHLIGEIPSLIFPSDEKHTLQQLKTLRKLGLKHVLCDNPGALKLALDMGFTAHGGPSLNLLNSYAAEEYKKLGLADATLSIEGAFSQVRKLNGDLPRGVIVYGYLPLMKLRACPAQDQTGCGHCHGQQTLRDPKGIAFTLICRDKKYSELLNSVPLYVGDKSIPRLDFQTLYFTTESRKECQSILALYLERKPPTFLKTGGLYYRKLL